MLSRLAVPVGIVGVWEAIVRTGLVQFDFVPAPSGVAAVLFTLIASGELFPDLIHTTTSTLLASTLAMVVGGAAGLAIGLVKSIRVNVQASIDYLRAIPTVTLIPAAVLAFGPVMTTEVVVGAVVALWPVLITTAAGVAAVPTQQRDIGRTLQLPPAEVLWKIVLPATAPAWLVGARISVIASLHLVIAAELLIMPRGLGGRLIQAMNGLALERMWAYAVVIGLVGYAINVALKRLVPWRGSITGGIEAPVRGLLPIAVLLAVWQIAGAPGSLIAPRPSEWWQALYALDAEGELWNAFGHTVVNAAGGLTVAIVVGVALGIAIGSSETVDRALSGTVDFIASIPGSALIPLLVLACGLGPASGVAIVAIIATRAILLSAATSMRSIPEVRREMSRTIGLSTIDRWRKVVLPSAAPGILVGIRLIAPRVLVISLLYDIFGAGKGLGRLLLVSQQRFDAATVWGLIAFLGALGYLIAAALNRADTVRRSANITGVVRFQALGS